MEFINALIAFLGHLVVSAALVGVFLLAYTRTTPHAEWDLIREGNVAAAIGLVGATIGFAIVLSRAIVVSNGIGETIVWGGIGLIVQALGHWCLSWLMPRLYASIAAGEVAAGIMKAGIAITLGLINAASMTP